MLLEISSSVEMLALVDHVSEHCGTMAGLDDEAAHHVSLAVREAVANGIKHGNALDPGKRVRIEYAFTKDGSRSTIVVRIRDEGPGFSVDRVTPPVAPEHVFTPSGRGLLLMRGFMDTVDVRCTTGGGTEIVMTKTAGS